MKNPKRLDPVSELSPQGTDCATKAVTVQLRWPLVSSPSANYKAV